MGHGSSEDARTMRGTLRVGDWIVHPLADHMSRRDATVRLEARTMRLLLCLASRPGEVVSIDDLLREVWAGVIVTPDSVYQAVTALRRLLGDDPKHPTYIATVPRRGYRLIAAVSWAADDPAPAVPAPAPRGDVLPAPAIAVSGRHPRRGRQLMMVGVAVVFSLLVGAVYMRRGQLATAGRGDPARTVGQARRSIAVVPFLDLTDGMTHEYF